MAVDVPVKCSCGSVTGVARNLSAGTTNHVMCSCKGCQSYAHFLGRTDDMLGADGASNIFQMDPKNFEITDGTEHVACMRVTKDGPLRWYADCCKTPLGNTFPRGGIPFLGVLPICTGHKGTSDEVVKLVGPVRGHVNPPQPLPFGGRVKNFLMLVRFAGKLAWWRIRGGKSWKPFFDEKTMKPICKPLTISDDERAILEAKAGF